MDYMSPATDSPLTNSSHSTASIRTAVVTGASSGIGAATARRLAAEGFRVYCIARRTERITALASEIGGVALTCDVTDQAQVDAMAAALPDRVDVLFNNAGGAFGQADVEHADLDEWDAMYRLNVLGTARVTQALLGRVEAAEGSLVFLTSTAAEYPYVGGAGYCGSKSAERNIAGAMRLELGGRPIRVLEISPGMVKTEEFSLTRLGSKADADAIYAGVDAPLVAEDIADCVAWAVTRPAHVNIDRMVVRPRAQVSNYKVYRG